MKLLDLTLDDPWSNVALDEALVEMAETVEDHPELLRFWEPRKAIVVLGRSSPIEAEVDLETCEQDSVPVVRRASGGATIVTGPGCLMYAVLLDYRRRPELRMLEQAHRLVMERLQASLERLGVATRWQGTCDLTCQNRKVSGNALRCKRNWLVYHGTLLCGMELDLLTRYLGMPRRQPEYRQGRSHEQFVTNLPVTPDALKRELARTWGCTGVQSEWPAEMVQRLVDTKYRTAHWLHKV